MRTNNRIWPRCQQSNIWYQSLLIVHNFPFSFGFAFCFQIKTDILQFVFKLVFETASDFLFMKTKLLGIRYKMKCKEVKNEKREAVALTWASFCFFDASFFASCRKTDFALSVLLCSSTLCLARDFCTNLDHLRTIGSENQ